ncbi:MAG: 3-deoxy-manno-octulosonate cytidylyltransferase [Chitinophagales bacterium]|nr:3-deoxy-manno-octulosonate cytidylyltransferase [Bacteroidota bacterium]MCB9226799.1 3-deoxy-manno-octulosonate cytidylyltransferase [Chitinophagales bacterium]
MKILAIIPARMASTRFPNKPLVNIGGKTMIRRVYEQAEKSTLLSKIIVATDSNEIEKEVKSFGGNVIMTATNHQNGTSRCAEVVEKLNETFDVVINIQGDEPFFEPESLNSLVACFKNSEVEVATLCKKIEHKEDLANPSVIKVVKSQQNRALYFSRTAIPFVREENNDTVFYKHIGIYAYKPNLLLKLVQLEETPLEKAEKLEQLRWLENDCDIYLGETTHDSNSVDTPEDLTALKKQFNIID